MDMNKLALLYIQSAKEEMAAGQILSSGKLMALASYYMLLNRPIDTMKLYNKVMMSNANEWDKDLARLGLKALILEQNQLGKFSLSDTNSKKILENLINAELLSLQKNETLDEASNNANKFLSDFHTLFTSEHEKKISAFIEINNIQKLVSGKAVFQSDLRAAAIQLRRTTASPTTNLAQSSIYKASVNAGQQLSKNIDQLLSKIYLGEYTPLSPDIVIVLQYFIKCCCKLLLCETTSMNDLIEESIGICDLYQRIIDNANTLEFVMQTCGGMSCEIDPTYAPNRRITEAGVEAWLIDRADRMQNCGDGMELKRMFR